jgi:hypothetical protein
LGRVFSLLDPWKKPEILSRVEKAEKIDDAIYIALEAHETPLTFNDLEELMPGRFEHRWKLTSALRRLLRDRKIQKVVVFDADRVVTAYATITDTQVLAAIPVKLLRDQGYEVSIGCAHSNQRKPYDLYEPKCDYLLIHINRSKAPNNPEKGEA